MGRSRVCLPRCFPHASECLSCQINMSVNSNPAHAVMIRVCACARAALTACLMDVDLLTITLPLWCFSRVSDLKHTNTHLCNFPCYFPLALQDFRPAVWERVFLIPLSFVCLCLSPLCCLLTWTESLGILFRVIVSTAAAPYKDLYVVWCHQ